MTNNKIDFSIREEVVNALNELNITLDEKQINDVLGEITESATFLDVVKLFVTYGIQDYCNHNEVKCDMDEIKNKIFNIERNMSLDDLL